MVVGVRAVPFPAEPAPLGELAFTDGVMRQLDSVPLHERTLRVALLGAVQHLVRLLDRLAFG
jgi:hypothetical protein